MTFLVLTSCGDSSGSFSFFFFIVGGRIFLKFLIRSFSKRFFLISSQKATSSRASRKKYSIFVSRYLILSAIRLSAFLSAFSWEVCGLRPRFFGMGFSTSSSDSTSSTFFSFTFFTFFSVSIFAFFFLLSSFAFFSSFSLAFFSFSAAFASNLASRSASFC